MSHPSKTNPRDIWQNEMLTVVEVATYLRISRITVWRWCKQGIIPAIQVGRSWRIHRDDLLQLSKPRYLDSEFVESNIPPIRDENLA